MALPFGKMVSMFAERVADRPKGECWHWQGHRMKHGYGRIETSGKGILATHIALLLDGRPRPHPKAHALHACDNPPCVNPAHLRWGDQRENNVDRDRRGRQVAPRGVMQSKAKLNDDAVRAIRSDRRILREIAADYGISIATAGKVKAGQTWSHVPMPA